MFGKIHIPILLTALLLLTACSKQDQNQVPSGTSWFSVLTNSLDLSRLAKKTEPHERSLHFSSSAAPEKTSLTHLAPEIFGDMDHGFFLRIEEHENYTDAVLAEAEGAGMVSWVWSANPTGELLLYINDLKTPRVRMPFRDFIRGKFLPVRYPFSAKTANGYNLHFPIIHSTRFKMVLRVQKKEQLATLYYQIAWNALNSDEEIHPFNADQFIAQKVHLKLIAKQMLSEPRVLQEGEEIILPAKGSKEIFNSNSSGTIQSISMKGDLAGLCLRAFWDGSDQPSINCPLHLLFGVSGDFEKSDSIPANVKRSQAILRWPMPFGSASRIELTNASNVEVSLRIYTQTNKTSAPLRLCAQHTRFDNLETDAPNILDLANIQGSGRIVGCTINVNSRTDQWWGEGDQMIWIDNSDKPVWRGTGTEDYFGFAWCSTKDFKHPLRGQTRVAYSRNSRNSTMHRYHILDTLPFQTNALFQTEAWGMTSGTMDYEALVLYYGDFQCLEK